MKTLLLQKKPDIVRAIQWTGDNDDEIKEFIGDNPTISWIPSYPRIGESKVIDAADEGEPSRLMFGVTTYNVRLGYWILIHAFTGIPSVLSQYAIKRMYEVYEGVLGD
jgi:hypothetical protein